MSANYPKTEYCIGQGSMVMSCNRMAPTPVYLKPDLPGTVIVIHGVNDVGTSYGEVEAGLCKGLGERMGWGISPYVPGTFRGFSQKKDGGKLEDDPDAVYFKRTLATNSHTPVIPFYWGFREDKDFVLSAVRTPHGQATDRYGNRLDKDFSKGGGPFANATSNLVDMWNSGAPELKGFLDAAKKDPIRPILAGPGRLYMVLAAQRLAALISMIRDYDAHEAVSIVAHSQGCLVSLLAQAMLMHQQQRPADTLILTHPPYSFETPAIDALTRRFAGSTWSHVGGGSDAKMAPHYDGIAAQQSMVARLNTLMKIVHGVRTNHKGAWSADELKHMRENGVHSSTWEPSQDRENRGKVYLYFCPEDMTVSLTNVQGIGWQGVPHDIESKTEWNNSVPMPVPIPGARLPLPSKLPIKRHPLKELGDGFLQRVFTGKKRPDLKNGKPFQVGLKPQNFALRVDGEDDQAHVAGNPVTKHVTNAHLPFDNSHNKISGAVMGPEYVRHGLRWISGETLKHPVTAQMDAGCAKGDAKHEEVDAIDAAIAVTSDYGLEKQMWFRMTVHEASTIATDAPGTTVTLDSTPPIAFSEESKYPPDECVWVHEYEKQAQAALNAGKPKTQHRKLLKVLVTLKRGSFDLFPTRTGKLAVLVQESFDEARLRHQHSTSERSFHGAIMGSAYNHQHVTAYDVAVGQGKAVSHPEFYKYLCAVADWRLKKPVKNVKDRPGILKWSTFQESFAQYWAVEPEWRQKIIKGNCDYYTNGELPDCIPLIHERPSAVVNETTGGRRSGSPPDSGKGGKA